VKYVSNPNLVAYWKRGKLALEDFERRRRVFAPPLLVELIHAFQRPRELRTIARSFPEYTPTSVRRTVAKLRDFGLLRPAGSSRRVRSPPATAWPDGFSAAYYHFANRDPAFVRTNRAYERFLSERLEEARQPPLYKTYPKAFRVRLPHSWEQIGGATLVQTLRTRRTVRSYLPRSISLRQFAAIVQGTWGQTGWVDAGVLGRLVAKTSPSAGARHPIECYVLASRVEGVPPGLYHYAVRSGSLERLRRGDQTAEALRFVAGCDWIRNTAFLCVMTAVTARLFWKYPSSGAYRLLFLDAGHLAQTFTLLATALGLGSFTTAAIHHSRIERLLGLDGVREFPLYVCGAGVSRGPHRAASRSVQFS
jgi:SagB-type dehydrogenase family enzyme